MAVETHSPAARPRRARIAVALLLLLALLLPPFVAVPLAGAASCIVTSGADDLTSPPEGSLRTRLLDASCEAITFQAGIGLITLAGTLPTITRPLSIAGPGAGQLTIQGNGTFPLLIIDASGEDGAGPPNMPVALSGLTLTRGHAVDEFGGNLRSRGANLTLSDLALTGATAAEDFGGSGAYLSGGVSTLTGVTISGNTAPSGDETAIGAGLFVGDRFGAAIVTITGGTIVGNTIITPEDEFSEPCGGGLAVAGEGDFTFPPLTVHLLDTTVGTSDSPNRAQEGGGICQRGGTLTLTNSTVSGNTAVEIGGGIFSIGGTLTVTNSTISGNSGGLGGGIRAFGTLALTNSTISGNSGTVGGGLILQGSATLTAATVVANRTTGQGGGVTIVEPASVNFGRSIVVGNRTGDLPLDCAIISTGPVTVASQGFNLFTGTSNCPHDGNTDILLTTPLAAVLDPALAANGGPTLTHAPVPGGTAVDRIPPAQCGPTSDQRGVARPQNGFCDIGAVEADAPAPTPSPSPIPDYTLTVHAEGPGGVTPVGGSYPSGTVVTLIPLPQAGAVFTGWTVDGQFQGWPVPLTLTMDAAHTVVAAFAPAPIFSDLPPGQPYTQPIIELAARVYIKGYGDGTYGPDHPILRAQMAGLIGRAMGYTDSPPNPFTDRCDPLAPANCVDDELWNRVAQLAARDIARGYSDAATCDPAATPCFAPRDAMLHAQVLSFITRAMVDAGYWELRPADPGLYGGVLNGTGHEQDVATFVFHTQAFGGVPDYPTVGGFPAWDQPATRGWFARALWAALNSHRSVDRVP